MAICNVSCGDFCRSGTGKSFTPYMCVWGGGGCHPINSGRQAFWDLPAGVIQEESHTEFLHLLSAVLAPFPRRP